MKSPFSMKWPGTVLLTVILFFRLNNVSAQDGLSDSQIKERLQIIRQMLDGEKPNADLWWYGWLIGYGAATVGQGVMGLTGKDKQTRQDMSLGAATTFLGAVGQIISPMLPSNAPDRFAAISENTSEERIKKLPDAERLLKACALREKEGRSWKTHAIAGVVNLGGGLVVWLGFKRSVWEGVGNFAVNTAIAEAQIWTQPTRAVDDYEEYVRGYRCKGEPGRHESKKRWSVNRAPGGIRICIQL
jgi:hypothetical protein